jgi:hypothetical protein
MLWLKTPHLPSYELSISRNTNHVSAVTPAHGADVDRAAVVNDPRVAGAAGGVGTLGAGPVGGAGQAGWPRVGWTAGSKKFAGAKPVYMSNCTAVCI